MDFQFKAATKRTWRGTTPITFTLPLLFDAVNNAQEDVHNKCVQLASLALPQAALGGTTLVPPNPTRLDDTTNKLEIRIGRQWLFPDMCVEGATLNMDQKLNNGFPIAGRIDLSVTTDYVMSREDFLQAAMLMDASATSSPLASMASTTAAITGMAKALFK